MTAPEQHCPKCPHDRGDSDHDKPYRFCQVITSERPGPFSLRELVKLTLLKLRVRPDGELAQNTDRADPAAAVPGD